MRYKKGDIFHDGVLGYWIFHNKPNGIKLFIVPLDRLDKPKEHDCSFYHDPSTWKLTNLTIICNLYDDPELAKSLLNDGNSLQQKLLKIYFEHA